MRKRTDEKGKMKKGIRGITLIALVVTIVVLLILAGVSINLLIGENGIISKTKDAKTETRAATVQEERNLWMNDRYLAEKTGQRLKSMDEILQELQARRLLTADEVERIKNDPDNKITIGSKTISFKVPDYIISATMTDLYKYYVLNDLSGYQLKDNGEDVISIENKEEMKYLAEYTNSSYITENVTFVLLNDIDLNPGIIISTNGSITGGTPETWTQIGTMKKIDVTSQEEWKNKISEYGKLYTNRAVSTSYDSRSEYYCPIAFKGNIVGNGNSIKGIYCNDETKNNYGLLGAVNGAKIENLSISNSYVSGGEVSSLMVGKAIGKGVTFSGIDCIDNYIIANKDYFGVALGMAIEGDIVLENVTSNNMMNFKDGEYYWGIGGIAGHVEGESCKIMNCSNYTNIESETYKEGVGGIVGGLYTNETTISNCCNKANIRGDWEGEGGIVGELICVNSKVYNCYNTGEIGGAWGAGGILGWDASDKLEIYDCYNLGKIYNDNEDGGDFGGIIGQCRADLTMYNCYNAGEIYASEENYIYGGDVGGLIGQNNEGNIYDCYNIGNINLCINGTKNVNTGSVLGIGGLIGDTGSEWVSNCFSNCNLTLSYPDGKSVERTIAYGEIIGSVYTDVTIDNCYGYSNKTINLPDNACEIAQNIGGVSPSGSLTTNAGEFDGYQDLSNSYPSVAINAEQITQNVKEVANFKSKEFCDMLNEWVNSNSGYSKWIYDANKNNGLPYLESLKDTID